MRGLTTAATLWVVAATGMAAGTGYYAAALAASALVLVSLRPLRLAAYRLRPEEGRLVVELRPGASAAAVLAEIERAGAQVASVEAEREGLDLVLRGRRAEVATAAAERVRALEEVVRVHCEP